MLIHGVYLQEQLYSLNNVLADCITFAYRCSESSKKSLSFNLLTEPYFLRKKRSQLVKLRRKLEENIVKAGKENSSSGGKGGGGVHFPAARRTSPSVDVSEMTGSDKQAREVQDLILGRYGFGSDDGFSAVGIVGMGSLGKTSLAVTVFTSPRVCQKFSPRIWVPFSEISMNGVEIVQYILEELDYDLDGFDGDLDISKLLSILKGLLLGRRYLIVLDNVSEKTEFYEDLCYKLSEGDRVGDRLSHGLPKGSEGAVMVTSRSEDVAASMVGKKNLFHLFEPFLSSFNVSEIIGLDEEAKKIEGMLFNNDGFAAVGIVGMGGSGKTALARKVFNSTRVCQEFSPRIAVCLSETYADSGVDMRGKILRLLLEELEYDLDELQGNIETEKLVRILKGLLSGKKYLIVLDDVWQKHEFCEDLAYRPAEGDRIGDHLSHGLPKGGGGAVIVTSRLQAVASSMVGGKNLVPLEPSWNADDCWKILTNIVTENRISRSKYNTFEKMREEVVDICNGLPLAATTVARLIAEQNPAI